MRFYSMLRSLSLRTKLVFLFSSLIGCISLFIYIYVPLRLEQQSGHALADKTLNISRMTAFSISPGIFFSDTATVQQELRAIKQIKDVEYIVIHNDSDNIVVSHNQETADNSLYEIVDTLTFINPDNTIFKTATPIRFENREIGKLYIGVSLRSVTLEVNRSKNTIALVSAIIFVIGLLAVIGISNLLTRPLRMMVKTMDKISMGDLSHRAAILSEDEVGLLTHSFNRMVTNLENAYNDLELLNRTLEKHVDERTQELKNEIAERKQTELMLRESEERFRQLSEASFEGIVIHREGTILEGNQALLTMFGSTLTEIVGRQVQDFIAPESLDIVTHNIRTRSESPYEAQAVRKDGTKFPIELIARMITYQGMPVRVTAVRDITAWKNVEQQLRDLTNRLQLTLNNLNIVAFELDPQGVFLISRGKGLEKLGYQPDELVGQTIFATYKEYPSVSKEFTRSLQGLQIQFEVEIAQGVWLFSFIPVFDEKHSVSRIFGTALDITERKRLEEQLRQSQKLESIGTLAGGIAHDFNNILGIILGYTTTLGWKELSKEQSEKHVAAIQKVVNRGAHLVRQLLTFARKTDVAFEPTDINNLITELVKMAEETFPKTIKVMSTLQEDLPLIIADHNQLHQALLNLCVNARDAMPAGGALFVSTSIAPKELLNELHPDATEPFYLCINISDSGMGMDKLTSERIFEPFFTTKEQGKGTGLGLAVVYGIIQSHRGFIDVESLPGIGTTFRIYLPMPAGSAEPEILVPQTEYHTPRGSGTILLVEDEELLIDLVETLLREEGYHILTARDGEQAVALYAENYSTIHLVITDLGLPNMNGNEAFLKMKSINPEIKAILATGYLEPLEKQLILTSGFQRIIPKPYEPRLLFQQIHEVLHS